jgi:hypothetical protein
VKYIVAGTQVFARALANDPRWNRVLETQHLVLFEAVRAPSRVEAPGWAAARVDSEDYVTGGGYRYAITLEHPRSTSGPSELLVKTNASPGWRATVGGRELATKATSDGLLAVELPADLPDVTHVDLVWGIQDLRRKGNLVSLVGALVALTLLGASRVQSLRVRLPPRLVQAAGLGGLVLALVACAARARKLDLSHVGFGLADGMATVFDAKTVRVGRFDDLEPTRPNHLVASAWGERGVTPEGEPYRRLGPNAGVAGLLMLGPTGANALTLHGHPEVISAGARADGTPVELALLDPDGAREACRVSARLGEEVVLPRECVLPAAPLDAPGVARAFRIIHPEPLDMTAIDVRSGIRWLEAESFRNTLDDGGGDAFYSLGLVRTPASNGVSMASGAGWDEPVDTKKDVELAPGAYAAWGLVRVFPEQFRTTRADIALEVDGHDVGTLGPAAREPLPFWAESAWEWEPIGDFRATKTATELTVSVRWREHSEAAVADVDAIALVPLP